MNRNLKTTLAALIVSSAIFACTPTASTPEATATTTENATTTKKMSDISIAYINNDTLVNNYEYFKVLRDTYEAKAEKIQKELQTRSHALERKMTSAQEKVNKGLVTRSEAQQLEASLQKGQQDLLAYRDKVMAEIQEEEQVMYNKLRDALDTYIAKYNETAKYDLILNQNAATNVIYTANPSLDITMDVLKGLNAEYEATKSTKTEEKAK